jgi:hypothetical protein
MRLLQLSPNDAKSLSRELLRVTALVGSMSGLPY